MPKVKVGQTVKKGDVITGAVGLEKDTYKPGINSLVLFHAMFGLVNEDALVVSESFASKMRSYSIMDLSIDVKANDAIKEILPIGSVVKNKDKIVTLYKVAHLDEVNKALQDKLGGIFGENKDFSDYTIEHSLEVPNNVEYAVISDVLIQENKKPKINKGQKMPDLTFAHTSQKVIDAYSMDRKVIYDKYPEYVAADRLRPIRLDEKTYKVVYTIRVRLIMTTKLMVGSKVTNRYGGKGVISKVLPDNQMPVVEDKQGKRTVVDIVMNPYSTINRKIPSVNMESLLGNIAHRIHDLVEEKKHSNPKYCLELVQKYYPGRFDDMTPEQFISYHDKNKLEEVYYFKVGSYSTKFTPQLVDQWAQELGVEAQSKILMPTNTIADLGELKANLSEDEYNEVVKDMEGKYIEVDKPLSVGYLNMINSVPLKIGNLKNC